MKFGQEKCAMLMRNGRRHITEEIELQNQQKSERLEKRKLNVLGNIRSVHHQSGGGEIEILKEYLRRKRRLHETKLYRRNLIKGINS